MITYQSVIRDLGGTDVVRVVSRTTIVDGSVLSVPADNIAFFVVNGQVSEPYTAGRWTIHTGESPFFVKLRHFMSHGDAGMTCQVWYINTRHEQCKSGGTGDLVFEEQRFHISMKARAAYTLRYVISEPRVFMTQVVGMHNNSFVNDDATPLMDSLIVPYVKQAIIDAISGHSIHTFQNELGNIGNEICGLVREDLKEYGIDIKAAAVTAINIPETEFMRLAKLEEQYASGTVETDIEVDNIKRVYGSLENRTFTEVVTGSIRGNGKPVPRDHINMLATLPLQMNYVNQIAEKWNDSFNGQKCPCCGREWNGGE